MTNYQRVQKNNAIQRARRDGCFVDHKKAIVGLPDFLEIEIPKSVRFLVSNFDFETYIFIPLKLKQ